MVERVEVGRRVVQLRVIPGRECVYRERGGGRRGGKIGIQLDGLNSIEHCVCVPGDTWCRSAGGDVLLASTRNDLLQSSRIRGCVYTCIGVVHV